MLGLVWSSDVVAQLTFMVLLCQIRSRETGGAPCIIALINNSFTDDGAANPKVFTRLTAFMITYFCAKNLDLDN